MRLSFFFILALAACAPERSVETAAAAPSPQLRVESVAEGLSHPWGLAFLPDGGILVTERDGRLRLIEDGRLRPEPVAGVPDVFAERQGGLLDVAIHPNFAQNRIVYLSYAHGTDRANATRLARARFTGTALEDVEVLFTAQPLKRGGLHFGGRLQFLPDGTLLLSIGEGFDYRESAQSLDNHLGKVVRLTAEGRVPSDNPFVGRAGALPEIYSYGHRNPQGFTRDPASGVVYEAEFGPRGGDELNVLQPGANYGWPKASYGVNYSGLPVSSETSIPGANDPLVYWTPSISPSGIAFYDGALFPAWRGDVFLANLSGMHLRRLDMENGRPVGQEALLEDLNERLRAVSVGPDGALYLLTDSPEGRVLRVTPAG